MTKKCPECGAILERFPCENCGSFESKSDAKTASNSLPMYSEFPPRIRPESKPEDRCPDCGKSVRDHITEFRALGEAITERVVRL